MSAIDLSVVVPLYNEADNVEPLVQAVTASLDASRLAWELVLVDDGSRDATFSRAAALVPTRPWLRVVRLRRNYGQTAAMAAGIQAATGRTIVTMDGDLQNDPADIPRLLQRLDEGFDIVAGWRKRRQDQRARVLLSRAANRIIARVMGTRIRDTGCSLKAFRAELLQGLPMYGDMHRFIPAMSRLAGARIAQMEVHHQPRAAGVSKYGFSRIWKVGLDIVSIRYLLWHARRPLRGSLMAALMLGTTGVALTAGAAWAEPPLPIVPGSLGILLASLAVFVGAGGFLGSLFAFHDRHAVCYALLSATVLSTANVQNKDSHEQDCSHA
ncbi:MAG: glycosyltransferase family 2 protein [Burkholderiaceae bacterium]